MLNILYLFPESFLLRLIAPHFMRLPVPDLALFVAVVGCLASGAFALGWYRMAKRTSPRVLGRHLTIKSAEVAVVIKRLCVLFPLGIQVCLFPPLLTFLLLSSPLLPVTLLF
jgi:hypothetical protein